MVVGFLGLRFLQSLKEEEDGEIKSIPGKKECVLVLMLLVLRCNF